MLWESVSMLTCVFPPHVLRKESPDGLFHTTHRKARIIADLPESVGPTMTFNPLWNSRNDFLWL